MAGLSEGDLPWPVEAAYQEISLILAALNLGGSTAECSPHDTTKAAVR